MTKNIVHVVGARPNFVKAAPVINALKKEIKGVKQIVIHTGQHYDANLSDIFFNALKIPKPDINLKVASSRMQGKQVADVIIGIEKYLAGKKVDLVVVYGDVNSTLGAAIAATKMGIPVAHIEAGLRSFDRTMPEETNRIIVDRISDFHFVTEQSAVKNLLNEGIDQGSIFFVGNTMIDSLVEFTTKFNKSKITKKLKLKKIPMSVCRSKSGGAHLFLFTKQSVSATIMRNKLLRLTYRQMEKQSLRILRMLVLGLIHSKAHKQSTLRLVKRFLT